MVMSEGKPVVWLFLYMRYLIKDKNSWWVIIIVLVTESVIICLNRFNHVLWFILCSQQVRLDLVGVVFVYCSHPRCYNLLDCETKGSPNYSDNNSAIINKTPAVQRAQMNWLQHKQGNFIWAGVSKQNFRQCLSLVENWLGANCVHLGDLEDELNSQVTQQTINLFWVLQRFP